MPHDVQGSPEPGCPYMGLASYTEDDADFFFGRDRERDLVIARLRAARLTLVYGLSGVGKSSLLNAGVVHRLKQLARFNLTEYGAPQFAVVSFASWQEDPLAELKRAVKEAVEGALGDEADVSVPDTGSLTEYLQACLDQLGGSLYVILDQFEESFRYSTHQEARVRFADEFSGAVNAPGLRVNFLISIREDMLGSLDYFEGRIRGLRDSMLRIKHLDRDGARLAIKSPLKRYGELRGETYEIEDELVDAVLGLAGLDEPPSGAADRQEFFGATGDSRTVSSLLQLMMERLWSEERRAGSRTLRLTTLQQRLGGARRIAETHVEERLTALSREGREIAADVFDRLVTPSGVKIAHTVSDLADWLDRSEADLEPVLDALSSQESRILRPVPEGRYEIFHDVLGRPIQTWLAGYRAASRVHEIRRRRWKQGLVALGCVLLAAIAAVGALVIQQWRDAVREARHTEAGRLAAESLSESEATSGRFILGGLLAVESLRTARTSDGELAARRILSLLPSSSVFCADDTSVRAIQLSPDGEWIAIATADNSVQVCTVGGESETLSVAHDDVVHALSYSPDGQRLAVAYGDGATRVWDLNTHAELFRVDHDSAVRAVSFSSDGRRLATGSDDGAARIWDVGTGTKLQVMEDPNSDFVEQLDPRASSSPEVVHVKFSSDGSKLATASTDNVVRIWDTGTDGQSIQLEHDRSIYTLSFSPDGSEMITVSEDGSIRVWDIAKGDGRERSLYGGSVTTAALSQDGERVAIGSYDVASVWHVETDDLLARMPHASGVRTVSFSPDGTRIATGTDDGMVQVWVCEAIARKETFRRSLGGAPQTIVLSPFGDRIAVADADGTLRVVESITGDTIAEIPDGAKRAVAVFLDPVGSHVMVLTNDRRVRMWAADGGEETVTFELPSRSALLAVAPGGEWFAIRRGNATVELRDASGVDQLRLLPTGWVQAAVFSGGGTRLATASSDHTARIWDLRAGEEVGRLDHEDRILALAISSDGTRLATADYGNVVRVWDEDMSGVRAEMAYAERVNALSFSPDGLYLATRSADRTVRLCDVASGRELARILDADEVTAIAFDVTGTQLVAVGNDSVWGWQVWPVDPVGELCARLPRNFTLAEWESFFPDRPYRCTCENLPPCE